MTAIKFKVNVRQPNALGPVNLGSGIRPALTVDAASLNSRVVAYYKMDEASGNRADSGAGGYTLTDNNTVTQAAGAKVGNAAQFTAANLEFLSSADAIFNRANTNYSFCMWIYPDTVPGAGVVTFMLSKDNAPVSTDRAYSLYIDGDSGPSYKFQIHDGASALVAVVDSAVVVAATAWRFVAFGRSAGQIWISVDAGAKVLATASGTAGDSASDFQVGAVSGLLNHDGRMDELGFFNSDLSQAELTYLYNSSVGRTYPFS